MRCPATEDHAKHMEHMKGLPGKDDRRQYLEQVRQTEGAFYAKWVRDDFAAWWSSGRVA